MVFLAFEPSAAADAISIAKQIDCSVWVGSDAISEDEHTRLTNTGTDVTRFAYPLSHASHDVIQDALATVQEHHPKEVIWLQHKFEPPY
jgi:hypothetical protein